MAQKLIAPIPQATMLGGSEAAIRAALTAAREEKEQWEQKKLEAEERIDALSATVLNLQRALSFYVRGTVPYDGPSTVDQYDVSAFADMNLRQILIKLAKDNEGSLKGRDAVRLLMRTGIIADRRSADAQVYTMLNRSAEFIKVQPGEYKLKLLDENIPF